MLMGAPQNLGGHPFPDPIGHFNQTLFQNPKYDLIQGFYGKKSIKIPVYREIDSQCSF